MTLYRLNPEIHDKPYAGVFANHQAHCFVPVELEASLKWCIRHNMQAYDGICSFRGTYGPCDIAAAAVVRIDKEK